MQATLGSLNALTGTIQAPRMIVGDEFQAVYQDIGTAVAAVTRIRSSIAVQEIEGPPVVVRVGFGSGEVIETGGLEDPQSGSAWWSAREALDHVAALRAPSLSWVAGPVGDLGVVRGFLTLLDRLIDGWDTIDHMIFLARLDGRTQTVVASMIGSDQSAVSKRINGHGIAAVIDIVAELER